MVGSGRGHDLLNQTEVCWQDGKSNSAKAAGKFTNSQWAGDDRELGSCRNEELSDAHLHEGTVWTAPAGLAHSSSTWMDLAVGAVLMEYKAHAGEHACLPEPTALWEPLLLTQPLYSDNLWSLRVPSP
ncbi:uncharacterized protein V6R79_024213 [Siganus canaliculatus]